MALDAGTLSTALYNKIEPIVNKAQPSEPPSDVTAYVQDLLNQLCDAIADETVNHILNNLEAIIPTGTYVETVSGAATGAPNVAPFIITKPNVS